MSHSAAELFPDVWNSDHVQEIACNPSDNQRRHYETPAYSREAIIMTEFGAGGTPDAGQTS